MKLYTEEQVKKVFFEGIKYAASIVPASMGEQDKYVQNTIDSLTPIELPSDEKIEKESSKWRAPSQAFRGGATWVIEQILNQNK